MGHRLESFLSGDMPDGRGRYIGEYFTKDDKWLENTHDYIQWVFPLKEPSSVCPDIPVLSEEEIESIKKNPVAIKNITTACGMMRDFYTRNPIKSGFDHNVKRVTRILRSLWLLGRKNEYWEFMNVAIYMAENSYNWPFGITVKTLNYWKNTKD